MTRVRCYECGTDTPAGSSFHVEDRVLCGHCADEQAVKRADAGLEVPRRTRVIDPTICEFCDADNGDTSLPLVAGMPACDACAARMRCHPFPGWLKGAAVVVILIVGVAFVRNWRFVVAHVEATRAVRAHQAGDIRHASALMSAASRRVPEAAGIVQAAVFFRGLELMTLDRTAEAVPLLRQAAAQAPSDSDFHLVLLSAEAGAAFDTRDYDGFLRFSQELASRTPQDATAVAQVASAYACKYAVTGTESLKVSAMEQLEKAAKLAVDRAAHEEYAERIRHRLATREIIDKDEYDRRFRVAAAGGR